MRSLCAFSIIAAAAAVHCGDPAPPTEAPPPDAGVVAPPNDAGVIEAPDAAVDVDAGDTRAIEPTWASLGASPMDGPRGRWGTPWVYVPYQRKFYLFGGSRYPSNSVSREMWSFNVDDNTWTQIVAQNSPPARYCHGLVYLPDQDQLLLIGGRNDSGPLPPGAWTFDLSTEEWTEVMPPYSPGVIGPDVEWMPDFPGGGRAVIFGGSNSRGLPGGTFAYDPVARKIDMVATSSSPPPHQDAAIVYDPGEPGQGGRLLVFSGMIQLFPDPIYLDELWEFNGTDWRRLHDVALPKGRRSMANAFDEQQREWILFSGTNETIDLFDLWRFDARTNSWMSLPTDGAPPARGFAAFALAPELETIYLFGGLRQPVFTSIDEAWSLRLRSAR